MPLRYLQLPDAQYIPSYTPISENLLARTHGMVAEQEMQELQQMDQMTSLRGEMVAGFQGLSDDQRMEASGILDQATEDMHGYVNRYGARGARQATRSIANRFERGIRPYQQASHAHSSVAERLKDSKADGATINWAIQDLGEIEYDEQGVATGWAGNHEVERDVSILEKWVPFHERLDKFNSRQRKGDVIEDHAFRPITTQDGRTVEAGDQLQYYRQKLEQVTGDQIAVENIAHLLSDPQMAAQLDLVGRMTLDAIERRAEETGQEPAITKLEDGRFQTKVKVPRTNDNGQFVDKSGNVVKDIEDAAVKIVPQKYDSLAEWQAAVMAEPYARRDSYTHMTFDTRFTSPKGGAVKGLSINDMFSTTVGHHTTPFSTSEFYKNINKENSEYLQQAENAQENINEYVRQAGFSGFDVDSETGEGMVIDENGNAYTLTEARNHGLSDSMFQRLNNLDQTRKDNVRYIKHNNSRIKSLERSIINRLYQDENYSELLGNLDDPNIYFDDQGRVKINVDIADPNIQSLFTKEVSVSDLGVYASRIAAHFNIEDEEERSRRQRREHIVGLEGAIGITSPKDSKNIVEQIPQGAVFEIDVIGNKIQLVKKGDKLYDLDQSQLFNDIRKMQDRKVESLQGTGAGRVYVIEPSYSEEHKRAMEVIETIKPGFMSDFAHLGNLRTADGKQLVLEGGEDLDVFGFGFHPVTGEFQMNGRVVDKETEEVVDGKALVSMSGDLSSQFGRRIFGDENWQVIAANQVWNSFLPDVYSAQNKPLTFTQSDLRSLGLSTMDSEGNLKNLQDVTIKFTRSRNDHGVNDIFTVKSGGRTLDVVASWDEARGVLEEETLKLK